MEKIALFYFAVASLLLCYGCESMPDNGAVDSNESEFEGIIVNIPEWTAETKAYSRTDLTTLELICGEKVAVITEEGKTLCFNVVESDKNKAVLKNPDVELKDGSSYRIQYPYPEVLDGLFMMMLGFGDYEHTPSLDWMISKWQKYKEGKEFKFNLRHINSVLLFEIVAPFDCEVEEVRLSTDDAIFCIKGAFDCTGDYLVPDRTAWTSQFQFPERNMTWVKGQTYTLILTLWPYDYSAADCTLDIYTTDDRGATVPITMPKLHDGEIKEYHIGMGDFEILPPPVYKKAE